MTTKWKITIIKIYILSYKSEWNVDNPIKTCSHYIESLIENLLRDSDSDSDLETHNDC